MIIKIPKLVSQIKLVRNVLKKFSDEKIKWVNDNLVEIQLTKTTKGKIKYVDDTSLNITNEKLISICKKELRALKKELKFIVTKDDIDKSLFKMFESKILNSPLSKRKDLFQKIEKTFIKYGIKKINFRVDSNKVFNELQMIILPIFTNGNVVHNESFKIIENNQNIGDITNYLFSIDTNNSDVLLTKIVSIEDDFEEYKHLMYKDIIIGTYLVERNSILLYYDPITIMDKKLGNKINSFEAIFDNLKILKPKKQKTNIIKEKLGIQQLLKNQNKKLEEEITRKNILLSDLSNMDLEIVTIRKKLESTISNIKSLSGTKNSNIKKIIGELKKIKSKKYIKGITFDDGINIKYVGTTFKQKNVIYNGVSLGTLKFYAGEITFHINATDFRISNTFSYGHKHPHADADNGTPCFGSGDLRDNILNYLSTNKLDDLTTLLWFWIKTYIEGQAYINYTNLITKYMKYSIPIWKEDSTRLTYEDVGLDSSIEPKKESNIEKFKNIELKKLM